MGWYMGHELDISAGAGSELSFSRQALEGCGQGCRGGNAQPRTVARPGARMASRACIANSWSCSPSSSSSRRESAIRCTVASEPALLHAPSDDVSVSQLPGRTRAQGALCSDVSYQGSEGVPDTLTRAPAAVRLCSHEPAGCGELAKRESEALQINTAASQLVSIRPSYPSTTCRQHKRLCKP